MNRLRAPYVKLELINDHIYSKYTELAKAIAAEIDKEQLRKLK